MTEPAPQLDPCPLCTTTARVRPWLRVPMDWRRPRAQQSYQLAWCDACAFGFLSPRPDPASIASFYEVDDYYTHGEWYGKRPPESLSDKLRSAIAWRLDPSKNIELEAGFILRHLQRERLDGLAVCDIGCGNGGMLLPLQKLGASVHGLEPDPAAAKVAREKGLDVHAGVAEALPHPFAPRQFDVITMRHVLEHVREPTLVLRNIASMLKPGGLFFADVPNNQSIGLERAGAGWNWLDVPRHLNFWTGTSLARAIEAAGMRQASIHHHSYTRQFGRAWIMVEQTISNRYSQRSLPNPRSDASEPGGAQAWKLLASTATSPIERKCDSMIGVGVGASA
jgi:SAM-dependent methyltransferase